MPKKSPRITCWPASPTSGPSIACGSSRTNARRWKLEQRRGRNASTWRDSPAAAGPVERTLKAVRSDAVR